MSESNTITLSRDCEAIQIPAGLKSTIPAGTQVIITQSLGGYTIACDYGLFRINTEDADALGLKSEKTAETPKQEGNGEVNEDQVWNQLRTVYDPEIPVNIVDLGLVYDCQITKEESGSTRVNVKMTLTAPGCGMGPAIAQDAKLKILSLSGIDEATVDLVWDPPWNQDMISEAGRMKLGLV